MMEDALVSSPIIVRAGRWRRRVWRAILDFVAGPVSASGTFNSGKNGNVTASLTVQPFQDIGCPGGQTQQLASVVHERGADRHHEQHHRQPRRLLVGVPAPERARGVRLGRGPAAG
jgi:hypothetical protein